MKVSLVITTYNWPAALDRVLTSVENQTLLPNEVIIADDGSTQETYDLIESYKNNKNLSIKHVWQPDEGFRAAAIRNKAILNASNEYIIFIDGDCIVRNTFIEMHQKLAKKGYFVAGNRSLLTEHFTVEIFKEKLTPGNWNYINFSKDQINRSWNLCYFPLGGFRVINPQKWKNVKTCNLGIWKNDLNEVNGFDEIFTGWGYEDSELVIRLIRNGIKHLNGRFATTVLHLWHKENDRSHTHKNWDQLQKVLLDKKKIAVKGLKESESNLGKRQLERFDSLP